nr:eyes absent homolog 1-like [Penaeus vannamei]
MVFKQLLILGVVVAATTAKSQIFEPHHPPMPHEFGYGVESPETGDVKEHKQTVSRTGRTDGEYRWLQPNGLYQVVRYYVDGDSGFQAHVSEEPGPGVGNYYSNSLSGESSVGFVPPLSHGVVGHHNPLLPGVSNVITPPSHVSFTGSLPTPIVPATAHGQTSLIPLTPTHVSVSSDLRPDLSFSSSRPGNAFSSFSNPGNTFSTPRPGNAFSSFSSPGNAFSSFSSPGNTFSTSRPGNTFSSFTSPGNSFSSFSSPGNSFSTSRPGNTFSSFTSPGNSFSSFSSPGNSFSSFSRPGQSLSFLNSGQSFSSFSNPGQSFSSFSRPGHSFSSVPRPSRVSLTPTPLDRGSFSTTVAPPRSFTTSPGFSTHQNFGGVTDGSIIHV